METAESRLKNTFFVVEATSFEKHCLWRNFAHNSDSLFIKNYSFKWEQMDGWMIRLGTLDNRPVNLDVSWVKINDQLVMFWDQCSQVTDYVMTEKWIDKHFKKNYDYKTDANNFHHCLHAIERLNLK